MNIARLGFIILELRRCLRLQMEKEKSNNDTQEESNLKIPVNWFNNCRCDHYISTLQR